MTSMGTLWQTFIYGGVIMLTLKLEISLPDRQQWEALALSTGQTYLASMQERLGRGIGATGQLMPEYSAGYKKTRRRRRRQTKVRDLLFTGGMRRAIALVRSEASPTGFRWVVGMTTGRARELAVYNQKRARWLGFAPEDIRAIETVAQDFITRRG